MRSLFLSLLVVIALFSSVSPAEAAEGECIILAGGVSLYQWEKFKSAPHDLWWMNFVRAARLRIEELRAQYGPETKITLLVYERAYRTRSRQDQQDLISNIVSIRDKYGVNLRFFNRTSEVIDYLNYGQPRGQMKIVSFDYFGHSNKACFLFDYSNEIDSASKVWLHETELIKLNRGIFARNAYAKSWGCHTGESMSRKFAQATGVRMWGAVGKTQYMTETLPILSSVGGRWTY